MMESCCVGLKLPLVVWGFLILLVKPSVMGIPSLEAGLYYPARDSGVSLFMEAMSVSLISCSSLGSLAQLIFLAFFFVALLLVKNKNFKGTCIRGTCMRCTCIWSYIYIFPFQETNTDFNQCCWLFYIVSTWVPQYQDKFLQLHWDSHTTHLDTGKQAGDDSVRNTNISKVTLRKQREPLDPCGAFLVLVHWDSFPFVAFSVISESLAGLH